MRILAILLLCSLAVPLGLCLGPSASDVHDYMQTHEYQKQKAEHLARWAR